MLNARGERFPLLLAGIACGFAIGTKNSFLVPGVALAALALRARPLDSPLLLMALLSTCVFWFARNLNAAGNPLGVVHLPGSATPDSPLERSYHAPLFRHLTDAQAWNSSFRPGLQLALGALWWLLLAVTLGGVMGALSVGRDGGRRQDDPRADHMTPSARLGSPAAG